MSELPFAYLVILRLEHCIECGQGERYINAYPTLKQAIHDRVIRVKAKWPDTSALEIIECWPDGRLDSLPLNCYADPPPSKRAIHWRWRDEP